jgi:D-galactarolactone cycloisomerase
MSKQATVKSARAGEAPHQARGLKITKIEVIALSIKLPRDYRGSVYSVPQKNALVTRISTDHGPIGEAVNGEGAAAIQREMVDIINNELAPLLIGQDPSRIEHLWAQMWPATFRGGRNKDAAVRAIACVDSALWDLMGKVAGLPLYVLWGGARDKLPIIAIGGQYGENFTPAHYGREMEEYRALGLAGCKFKVGGKSPAEDAERTVAARKAGGDDFILCVDANRGWPRAMALEFARLAQGLNLRWFEEPCHWSNDKNDMALLRAITGLPIVAGQSEVTAEGCRDLMVTGAIDVCNLDASWGGGPTVWLRVARMAQCFSVEMGHHGEPVVGSHLLSAVENGTYVETHHPDRDPIFHRMVVGRGAIADGFYTLPDAPGFGVTFDPDFIKQYRVN